MTRTRDYPFEALAEVTGTDWNTGRGELNAALKLIRDESEIEDGYLLADEIHERAKMYREIMGPDVLLTPNALAKHYTRVYQETEKRRSPATKGINQYAAPTQCETCGGDRFVVVATRPVKQSTWMKERGIVPPEDAATEEYAPCPACSPHLDTTFYRHDGTPVRPPDSARVREMMNG